MKYFIGADDRCKDFDTLIYSTTLSNTYLDCKPIELSELEKN